MKNGLERTPIRLFIGSVFFVLMLSITGCGGSSNGSEDGTNGDPDAADLAGPGEILYAHVESPENGRIAVRIDIPEFPRYQERAPVVVVASTWFVDKYSLDETEFHLVYNPQDVGCITLSHLWPGKTDPDTGVQSDGEYDYGGPLSLAALRDVIRFALGLIPDVDGNFLHELIGIEVLYDNVGLFASSHAGVVATNVMAYFGEAFPGLAYFVGRENPTMPEMYPLEIGHWDESHNPIYNPYYDYTGYTPSSISVNYFFLTWIANASFPDGSPLFSVPGGDDYVLDDKGPRIDGVRFFSYPLTKALEDNGVFHDGWPDDVATAQMAASFWPYRTPVGNYEAIGLMLPDLKVLLPFASDDHVQTAPDKPHIRQAYDGFRKSAGLWTRLNCDLAYVQREVHASAALTDGFPDNEANSEPGDWYSESEAWGFAGRLNDEMTARTIPLSGIAEMADRVYFENWEDNLSQALLL